MRIIGGRDYYDSARAFGEDRETVFIRAVYEKSPWVKTPFGSDWSFPFVPWDTRDCVEEISVVFCGKIYNGVAVRDHRLTNQSYHWSVGSFKEAAKEYDFKVMDVVSSHWDKDNRRPRRLSDVFSIEDLSRNHLNYAIENGVVIAIRNPFDRNGRDLHDHWKVNTDGLKDIAFPKVIDPYSAFQEISMFVGGVLPRSGNPMVELTGEKIMLQKHGMDKWSFRRQKGERK